LHDDLGLGGQEDCHAQAPGVVVSAAAAASPAPSSMVSASVTSGCAASVRMPLATASQEVIPPKTLTKTDFTDGSPRMISSPSAITSAEAPPPISRKLAGRTGWPPWLSARAWPA